MRVWRARLPAVGLTISRGQLIAGLFIFSSTSGLLARVIKDVAIEGWSVSVLNTFNISIIVWGAWASACYLALSTDDRDPIRPLDIAASCVTFTIAALPAALFSWLALSIFSSYVYLTSPRESSLRCSAAIFFAICVPLLWGPMLFHFAAPVLLKVDALLVATLIGAERTGNVVDLVGIHRIQIWPGCSSFHNISHAALAWVALTQTLGRDLEIKDVFWCGFAMISAASVNLARVSMIALWPAYYDTIHGPVGGGIAGALTIILIAFVCILGQRRELFARA
jgi:hypothetical protein